MLSFVTRFILMFSIASSLQAFSWVDQLGSMQREQIEAHTQEAKEIIESTRGIRRSSNKKCHLKSASSHTKNRYPRLLVFVSFSMTNSVLKALARDVKRAGGKLVFRGLVRNSFKDTAAKFKNLGIEALVDPTLFKTFKVSTVPTFLITRDSENSKQPYDILRGNVSLHFALTQFATQGEVKHSSLLLKQLRGKND